MVAIVDDADYESVMAEGKWHAVRPSGATFYASRRARQPSQVAHWALHTFLTGWPLVDHINGDGLDNRRANLRAATPAQNGMNRTIGRNNTSGYKGVVRNRANWRARLETGGRIIQLGTFGTREEAARAYDAAAVEHFGEFALLNFPQTAGPSARINIGA